MTTDFKADPLKHIYTELITLEGTLLGIDIDVSAALVRIRKMQDVIRPTIIVEEASK